MERYVKESSLPFLEVLSLFFLDFFFWLDKKEWLSLLSHECSFVCKCIWWVWVFLMKCVLPSLNNRCSYKHVHFFFIFVLLSCECSLSFSHFLSPGIHKHLFLTFPSFFSLYNRVKSFILSFSIVFDSEPLLFSLPQNDRVFSWASSPLIFKGRSLSQTTPIVIWPPDLLSVHLLIVLYVYFVALYLILHILLTRDVTPNVVAFCRCIRPGDNCVTRTRKKKRRFKVWRTGPVHGWQWVCSFGTFLFLGHPFIF